MEKKCESCNKNYEPHRTQVTRQRYCSKTCEQTAYRLARRIKYEAEAKRTCLSCATEFMAAPTRVRGKLSQRFCSERCARDHRNQGRRKGPGFKKSQELSRLEAEQFAASVKTEDAAYFAGLIDGEGTITTHLCDNRHARGRGFTERIRVSIGMTHEAAIRSVHETFSGHFRKEIKKNTRWNDVYVCELNGWRAYACLLVIFPYLITKREQAHLAIEFQRIRKTVTGSRMDWHPEVAAQRRDYHDRIRKLNRRGRQA